MSEVNAAKTIQARFRENKVRKEDVKNALATKAATKAATKIQSVQRGKLGRHEAAERRAKIENNNKKSFKLKKIYVRSLLFLFLVSFN
eukprot:COSAG01_NODE_51879_length_351_cov_0.813492_1_plen_87_part_01